MATANRNIPGGLAGLGKLTELRQRIFFLLGALVVFRICTHIPVPGRWSLCLTNSVGRSWTCLICFPAARCNDSPWSH